MEKIKKAYSMKIISIAVIMCFLITNSAYPDTFSKKYCLRPQLDFDNFKRASVITRYKQALNGYVEHKISLRNMAMQVAASLRPNIKEDENLTAQEFEEHIRILARELQYPYGGVERIGFFNFFNMVKDDFSSLSPLYAILELITFSIFPYTDGYLIKMQGKTAFILPLIAVIGVILLIPYPWNISSAVIYLYSLVDNLLYGYKTDNGNIRHELKHVYVFLILEKLKEKGLLNLPLNDVEALFPSDYGFPMFSRERINIRELEKIENTVIDAVFPEPNPHNYTDGLPKSDIPANAESLRRVKKIRSLHDQL